MDWQLLVALLLIFVLHCFCDQAATQLAIVDEQHLDVVTPDENATTSPPSDHAIETKSKPNREPPVGLDEYKRKTVALTSQTEDKSRIHHRVEPGGEDYNYASAAHGAKVVSANKEAKGAANVLNKDEEKYLRNPCSAEDKFVVVEFLEETLVDTVVIANYELYSSNPKEFELLGSLVYPTEEWKLLGMFEAENVRHPQKFVLSQPDWVKFLKLRMLTHYGTEFFCTLSSIEVFGVDAIKRMLEDWINSTATTTEDESVQKVSLPEKNDVDSVIKLLMQKVKKLELEETVYDNYLELLNSHYRNIFAEYDQELASLHGQLKQSSELLDKLQDSLLQLEWKRRNLEEMLDAHMKSEVSAWSTLSEHMRRLSNKELVVFTVALITSVVTGFWMILSPLQPSLCAKMLLLMVFFILLILSS